MTSVIRNEVTSQSPEEGEEGNDNFTSSRELITSSLYGTALSTLDKEDENPIDQLITSPKEYSTLNGVTDPITLDITPTAEGYTTIYGDSAPEIVVNNTTSALPEWPQGEPEGEGIPEEYPGERDSGDLVASEPVPDWTDAKQTWGLAWHLYIYGIGFLFLVIALYSLVSLIRLSNNKGNLVSRAYFISLNLMLCLMGSTRAIYFLVDAYNSNGTFPRVVTLILFGTTFPCLSGAFSLQFLALLQTLRVNLMRPKVQKLRNLAVVIAFNFLLSLTADIVVGLYQTARIYMLVCQIMLTLWGLFLSAAYFYAFKRLLRVAKRRQKEMLHNTTPIKTSPTAGLSNLPREKPKLTMVLALKVTLITSVSGGVIVALQIYSMTGVYGVLSQSIPEAWPWWAYQLIFRLVELLMASTMVYVASQPMRYSKAIRNNGDNEHQQATCHCSAYSAPMVIFLPCYRLFWPAKLQGSYELEEMKWLEHSQTKSREPNGVHSQYRTFPVTATKINGLGSDSTANIINGHNRVNKTGSLQTTTAGAGNNDNLLQNQTRFSSLEASDDTRSHHLSMLVNEGGYIRFREDGDPIQDVVMTSTDDDELDSSTAFSSRNHRQKQQQYRSLIWERMGLHKPLSADQCLDTSSETSSSAHNNHHWLTNINSSSRRKKTTAQCRRSTSVPNTSSNTPMGFLTPKSLCSTDFDGASTFSFKPPSSIHLRDSIDKALNYFHFNSNRELVHSPQSSQNLSDCLSKTPDSLGSNNPCFKYDPSDIIRLHEGNGQGNVLANKSASASGQLKQSKTHLLCQHLAELRSRGASTLSLDVEIERASSSEPTEEDLTLSEISKRASLCRSNSDIILL